MPAVIFALNLEYLEGSFYSCATTGAPLPASVTGSTTVITEGCARGNYTEETYDVFGEIAADELNHVKVSNADAHINHDDGAIQALSRAPWPFPCCMPQPWLTHSACTLPLTAHRHLMCLQTFSTEFCLLTISTPATMLPRADLPPVLPAVPPERSDCRWRNPCAPATAEPDFPDHGRPAGLPQHRAGVCLWCLHAGILCGFISHESASGLCHVPRLPH